MFENSVVPTQTAKSTKSVLLLPVSLALHLVAVAGVIFGTVWNVELPENAPPQFAMYAGIQSVPIPPASPPPPQRARTSRTKSTPTLVPSVVATPMQVQENPLPSEPSASSSTEGEPGGQPGGEPGGTFGGIPNGIPSGEAPTQPIFVSEGSEVTKPVTISRVDPRYPPVAIALGLRGAVIILCTVDRDGAVRDVRIVKSVHPSLDQAVIEAVRQWRFKAGTLRGKPVDTMFHLTVNFDLKRR